MSIFIDRTQHHSFWRRLASREAFTLVELLVVIAIMGTLVGLLLPAVYGVTIVVKEGAANHFELAVE